MTNTRLVAYALIAIGIVALLSRLTPDAGWLWIGLVAAGFLYAYQRERVYPFLVVGGILMGVAVGILLEGNWHWPGAFLVSLGAGVAAIDLAAPRANRWPRLVGLVLIALGVITGLAETGFLTSAAFAILLIAGGLALVFLPGRPPRSAPGSAPAGAPASAPASAPARASAAELRRALLAWRSETARAEDRGEGMVLRDDVLETLLETRPATLEELAAVKGVGPVTLERYGEAILERLRGG